MATFSDAKFVTFDCYGTLIWFQMNQSTQAIYGDRLPADSQPFFSAFKKYRYDEVLGDWKPYRQIIRNAFHRTTHKFDLEYDEAAADAIYESIGTWGPHPDVPDGLAKVAAKIATMAMRASLSQSTAAMRRKFQRKLPAL